MAPPGLPGFILPSPLQPAPWHGADLARDEASWSWAIEAHDVAALCAAARAGSPVDDGWASSLRRRFEEGPGVLRLRGLPVDDERLAGDLLLAIGQALGPIRRQSRDGAVVLRVLGRRRPAVDIHADPDKIY